MTFVCIARITRGWVQFEHGLGECIVETNEFHALCSSDCSRCEAVFHFSINSEPQNEVVRAVEVPKRDGRKSVVVDG